MDSNKLRREFLKFFEKKGHEIVPSSSLLPADPSVLFTTAGMQQFKSYFLGEKSPYGDRACSCQKCFRTSDIEEVGDESHVTFLEMLGNFSFGGYFKEEAIKLAHEFIFKELKLPLEKAIFTVFEGDQNVPEDKESAEIWEKLGVPGDKIKKCGREDNFWGPTGKEGPCGPTTEIHFNGTEIWNLVFNEYYQDQGGKLSPLKQKGVDTGMGLERLAMAVQQKSSVYETDLFLPIISEISSDSEKAKRIIADHIKGVVFLISEGILPSNVERGYVVRRLLRRIISFGKLLNLQNDFLITLVPKVIALYKDVYLDLAQKQADIIKVINDESERFEVILEKGIKEMEGVVINLKESGARAVGAGDTLRIEQSSGVPFEIQKEFFTAKGIAVQQEEHEAGREKHREISRAGAEKKFKGGLADHSEKTTKYHTATHLLLAALRQILGTEIYQKGSNITVERLRFDFNYPEKLDESRIKEVEDLVNQKIKEDIKVELLEMPKAEALKIAKISFDPAKYGEMVKVYKIGEFSIELCGGPHIGRTGELGHFKIVKEESSGAGVRRIRAVLE